MADYLSIAGLIIIVVTLAGIIASNNWRFTILCLSLQYLGCIILLSKSLPLILAASKLISGWIAGAILGMALAGLSPEESQLLGYTTPNQENRFRSQSVFRLLVAGMVALVAVSLVPKFQEFIPGIEFEQSLASALMICISLIQLSLISRPFDVVIGLLIILSGFEIMYSVVETSALVIGLLAVVDLGLALVGAYLIFSPTMERVE